jgi:hypothetical protein
MRRPRFAAPQRRVARRRLRTLLPYAVPLLRWALRPRAILAFACLAVVLHVVEIARSGTPSKTYAPSWSAPDLRTALPDLRTIAASAAGGPVHGPATSSTSHEYRLTFRRGRCRIIVRIDHRAEDYVAGARLTKGRRCAR